MKGKWNHEIRHFDSVARSLVSISIFTYCGHFAPTQWHMHICIWYPVQTKRNTNRNYEYKSRRDDVEHVYPLINARYVEHQKYTCANGPDTNRFIDEKRSAMVIFIHFNFFSIRLRQYQNQCCNIFKNKSQNGRIIDWIYLSTHCAKIPVAGTIKHHINSIGHGFE